MLCYIVLGLISMVNATIAVSVSPYPGPQTARYPVTRGSHVARNQSHPDVQHKFTPISLDYSWEDDVLLEIDLGGTEANSNPHASEHSNGTIEVLCQHCYVTGSTSGLLILDDGINLSNFIETFEDDVNKIRSEVWNWLIDALSEVGETLTSLIPNAKPVKLPSLNINLDRRNLHPDPRIRFRFSIHGLEIYIALEAKISVQETITVHLFTSETPLGVSLTGGEIGAVFAVDLILVADAEVEIGTGLHLMLDDNLVFDLEVFNKNVSKVTFPGARYEFLPVKIQGQGNLRALLRLQIRTGFRVGFDNLVSAGMESSISAYLVDLTISGNGSSDADEDCYLGGFAAYTLGLGAAAGASVAYGDAVWGPTPETTVPIFHASTTTCFDRMANTPNSQSPTLTGLSSTSPASASAETTSLSSSAKRGMDNGIMDQERGVVDSHIAGRMTSAEATTTVDAAPLLSYGKPQTLVVCKSKGLVECPHQLQSTATAPPIRAKTAPSAPPSGSSFTAFRKGFSRNVQTIEASSGAPVSYTPPPPPPTTTTSASSGTSVSHTAPSSATSTGASPKGGGNTHVAVIAVCAVASGIFLVLASVATIWFIRRHRDQSATAVEKASLTNGSRLAAPPQTT